MSSTIPVVRQMSWLGAVPQLVALAIAAGGGALIGGRNGMMLGSLAYLAYSTGSRRLIPRAHSAGVGLMLQQRFEEAIPRFQESFAFFERHAWIDRYRSLVLMSPSALSYREMALANIAFCHGQMGNGEQARLCYEQCLEQFPNSGVAMTAVRMLDSVSPRG